MSAPQPLTLAAPRHFAGRLVEKDLGTTLGLHQLGLRFIDDEAGSHIVYIAHGRGSDAQRRADMQYNDLQIGQRYFGSSTVCRPGALHTYWVGSVTLALDKRRQRFAQAQAGTQPTQLAVVR